jgi:RiboL-PSP-HEPN
VRAGIALLYAHWEGFIKTASLAYLNYINNQGVRYQELKSCFVVFGLKAYLNLLVVSRKADANGRAIDFVLEQMDKPAKLNLSAAVDTESNLTSKVFGNIAASLSIAPTTYETKYNLIDQSLVKRRNRIAHGEYLDVNAEEWSQLADEILSLIRQFKTDIENAATLELYKRSLAIPA